MINQPNLIVAILKELKRQKVKALSVRKLNTVVAAANLIIIGLGLEDVPSVPGQGLAAWLSTDDTGASSRYMAFILAGGPSCEKNYPEDPSDFGRCYRFLRAVPEDQRQPIGVMAKCSPTWSGLVKAWPELERLWEKESPSGKCPKLYDRMKDVINASAPF